MLESRAPDAREGALALAFVLPPRIPHPMAAMGELPGLEFSEADLVRYAELYERGSERWSKLRWRNGWLVLMIYWPSSGT
jgi:hypothetical protein